MSMHVGASSFLFLKKVKWSNYFWKVEFKDVLVFLFSFFFCYF